MGKKKEEDEEEKKMRQRRDKGENDNEESERRGLVRRRMLVLVFQDAGAQRNKEGRANHHLNSKTPPVHYPYLEPNIQLLEDLPLHLPQLQRRVVCDPPPAAVAHHRVAATELVRKGVF